MNNETETRTAELKKGFLALCDDLWDTNQERFINLLKNSIDQKIKLSLGVDIEWGETLGMDVQMSYGGQKFKDKRTKTFDDPSQMTLEEIGRRPGTGLPEMGEDARNGHSGADSTQADGELEASPAAYKARHPESNGDDANGESSEPVAKAKRRKKSKSKEHQKN